METPVSSANRYKPALAMTAVLSALAITSCNPSEAIDATPSTRSSELHGCATYFDVSRFRNHEYEVCTAYVVNSAQIALQGFYKFGNNDIGYLAGGARHHFETRYWQGPRRTIEREVDSWPKTGRLTGNAVHNSVGVVSLSSNLSADRGLLTTRESWKVTGNQGQVLHRETDAQKDITMCRGKLPGHLLHEWMVVKYQRDPNFDCIAFDRQRGIKP